MPRPEVIGVMVSDLMRSIGFYAQLGIEFPDDPDPMGHGHVEASQPGGLRYKEAWEAFWGQRYAQVKDPDGNLVDLFAALG
jgi:catechol 2,3-dioxygenase-like lactoylglutathione lyase family enzyme